MGDYSDSLFEILHLLREQLDPITREIKLLQGLHIAERYGELVEVIVREGEGDQVMEDTQIIDPAYGSRLAQDSCICLVETLLEGKGEEGEKGEGEGG